MYTHSDSGKRWCSCRGLCSVPCKPSVASSNLHQANVPRPWTNYSPIFFYADGNGKPTLSSHPSNCCNPPSSNNIVLGLSPVIIVLTKEFQGSPHCVKRYYKRWKI